MRETINWLFLATFHGFVVVTRTFYDLYSPTLFLIKFYRRCVLGLCIYSFGSISSFLLFLSHCEIHSFLYRFKLYIFTIRHWIIWKVISSSLYFSIFGNVSVRISETRLSTIIQYYTSSFCYRRSSHPDDLFCLAVRGAEFSCLRITKFHVY